MEARETVVVDVSVIVNQALKETSAMLKQMSATLCRVLMETVQISWMDLNAPAMKDLKAWHVL